MQDYESQEEFEQKKREMMQDLNSLVKYCVNPRLLCRQDILKKEFLSASTNASDGGNGENYKCHGVECDTCEEFGTEIQLPVKYLEMPSDVMLNSTQNLSIEQLGKKLLEDPVLQIVGMCDLVRLIMHQIDCEILVQVYFIRNYCVLFVSFANYNFLGD